MFPGSCRAPRRLWLVALLLILHHGTFAQDNTPRRSHLDSGLKAFQRGAMEEAIANWSDALRSAEAAGHLAEHVTALEYLARAYASLGRYSQAIQTLRTALNMAEPLPELATIALLAALGNAHVAVGPPEVAESYLQRGLRLARQYRETGRTAAILNDLGNLHAGRNKLEEAVAAYRESAGLARGAELRLLAARALGNAAHALRQQGKLDEAQAALQAAWMEVRQAAASHETVLTWIQLGLASRDLGAQAAEATGRLFRDAANALNEAGTMAEQIGDARAASYAWGHLGALYEAGQRFEEALRLSRKAIFFAQRANAPESLYRWQWQVARLLKRVATPDEAIGSYRRAVHTLQSIRQEFSTGPGPVSSFRDTVGRVYFELVDLLLQRAGSLQDPARVAAHLVEARDTVELFKVAELRDYFRDDCVDTALSTATKLDVVSASAAVVYPVLLPDRIELLVSLPTGLKRFSLPVSADTLTAETRQFRLALEKRTTREFLPRAQQLYRWLIAPLEADLAAAAINTVVFVPDGPLRTISMAALHDGERFLVEKYALAVTPGLALTDPRPIARERLKVLALGVTESVQGFPPLPNVATELEVLRDLFASTTLLNNAFSVSALERELKQEPFTILHIASHGEFGNDVKDTFLLTFDDRLTMDRLNQVVGLLKYRKEPLELLTLSACDTAAGDDRAALGLAGVAIKAGARSALATLWNINDVASSRLVAEFYRELKDPSVSRAAALQRAQMKMLSDPRYDHPGFWSPFLLINNWL
jgi:CHAT domain-containing protein